ncbi:MAG: glycine cleavage system protein H [Pirellulales bacterium]|nr:glycine cleavage system protein H [Pirellulales bacterium]
MADTLTFMMGEYEAVFPTDRQYARNHMWAQLQGTGCYRCGFAAYAVRLLQDVYFLDWDVTVGRSLSARQEIGQIESQKAEASLYAPLPGTLTAINELLLKDPSAINVDKYGAGWLFEIEGKGNELLSPGEYLEHLGAVWEVTQRTIKGQMNK